jgi:hypothetical protein
MNTTYATKEIATRMGNIEAAKLTARGYATKVIEVREVAVTTSTKTTPGGDASLSDWSSVRVTDTRWEAILS